MIWLLVKQEMRIILSDKKALALLFLMPALLIVFLSLALKDIYQQKVGKNIEVVFLTEKNPLSEDIIKQFSRYKYSVSQVTEHEGLETFLKKRNVQVAIEMPENILDLIAGKNTDEKMKIFFDPSLDKAYMELIKSHFLSSIQSMIIDQVNERLKSNSEGSDDETVQVSKLASPKDLLTEVGEKEIIPNPIQQTVPAWALFAMFFIALPMSSSFIRDRETGILKRLLCYNVSKPILLIGKIIPLSFY